MVGILSLFNPLSKNIGDVVSLKKFITHLNSICVQQDAFLKSLGLLINESEYEQCRQRKFSYCLS